MTPKERLHAALSGQAVDRTPLTPIFMAWAAHAVGHTYRDYYLDHHVMVKAQLAVTQRFGLDQISSISDPWRESSAFGMQLDYPPEGVGIPQKHLLEDMAAAYHLQPYDPLVAPRTSDRIKAVTQLVHAVGSTHSVLGWVEGAMAEYADLRGVELACLDLLDEPDAFHAAAKVIVDCAIHFAELQIKEGADVIGIGDAAASLIGPELYVQHVLPWEQILITAIHDRGAKVKLHICGNITSIIPAMATSGADIIDVDYVLPLAQARQLAGPNVCLAGNFNPTAVLLQGTPAIVRSTALQCIKDAGPRFILQPGCEVPPGTAVENIEAFCQAV